MWLNTLDYWFIYVISSHFSLVLIFEIHSPLFNLKLIQGRPSQTFYLIIPIWNQMIDGMSQSSGLSSSYYAMWGPRTWREGTRWIIASTLTRPKWLMGRWGGPSSAAGATIVKVQCARTCQLVEYRQCHQSLSLSTRNGHSFDDCNDHHTIKNNCCCS